MLCGTCEKRERDHLKHKVIQAPVMPRKQAYEDGKVWETESVRIAKRRAGCTEHKC